MERISKEALRGKMVRGEPFALVDVLSPDEYERYHLPGAINVPITRSFIENIQRAVPDKQQEVVVYCQSEDCPASPTAARCMEELGYESVLDYAAGRDGWRGET